ncbi:MAG: hypothetical protein JKY19_11015 [Alcanivoracaceae bacterium]|nr:hypothetical protein [Alcanivoracaceae bacterium]
MQKNTKNRTYVVEMLCNNRSLTMIVSSLMKIINLNGKSYVLSLDSHCNADILFVDSDDELAMKQVQIRKQRNNSIPVIITSTKDKNLQILIIIIYQKRNWAVC